MSPIYPGLPFIMILWLDARHNALAVGPVYESFRALSGFQGCFVRSLNRHLSQGHGIILKWNRSFVEGMMSAARIEIVYVLVSCLALCSEGMRFSFGSRRRLRRGTRAKAQSKLSWWIVVVVLRDATRFRPAKTSCYLLACCQTMPVEILSSFFIMLSPRESRELGEFVASRIRSDAPGL